MTKGKQRKQAEIRLHEVIGMNAGEEQIRLARILAASVADGKITLAEAIEKLRSMAS